ncbi:FGGY family pentulose kinase [Pseudoroseicyclus tamaricis]|uniref:Ribulokinase n=1 Tax=Pseudoroseicyclus tamaricis TaxID=2705421 RepID=A0A6B2JUJ2_9RHOB|nr:FGGY family pentulose kinase [Pseudoroseicyclus tamaricis]NDV01595.1 ribulokinase [Pseudoroseicyclus tamaricis]
MSGYICAVDVGTRSARAGLFDASGRMLAREVAAFRTYEDGPERAEYASEEIWASVCAAVRQVRERAGVPAPEVKALAFDATCSLVLQDSDGVPLALGPGGRDTIAWFDHRATAEAAEVSASGHALIRHHGGAMSPEMQTPKLLWLKRHRPELWAHLGAARDLTDHLAWRATGQRVASACTLAAKWPYLPEAGGWQDDFLAAVGLEDLRARAALPEVAAPVGAVAGTLTGAAAASLRLAVGTPVAVGLVDAYAGALGCLGAAGEDGRGLTLIAGTSISLMAVTEAPVFAPGIWGPFRDAVLPGLWCSEGGQSAAGALLDYVLDLWPGHSAASHPTHDAVLDRIEILLERHGPAFGRPIHVLPDFRGNRSPLADAGSRGVISGLTLDRSFDGLCALYWRAAVGLALGARQILGHMGDAGLAADRLAIVGGLTRSPLISQLYADATGLAIHRPEVRDSVLLGTAMAGAVAAGLQPDLTTAARAMAGAVESFTPDATRAEGYGHDYAAFRLMQRQREELAAV